MRFCPDEPSEKNELETLTPPAPDSLTPPLKSDVQMKPLYEIILESLSQEKPH